MIVVEKNLASDDDVGRTEAYIVMLSKNVNQTIKKFVLGLPLALLGMVWSSTDSLCLVFYGALNEGGSVVCSFEQVESALLAFIIRGHQLIVSLRTLALTTSGTNIGIGFSTAKQIPMLKWTVISKIAEVMTKMRTTTKSQ